MAVSSEALPGLRPPSGGAMAATRTPTAGFPSGSRTTPVTVPVSIRGIGACAKSIERNSQSAIERLLTGYSLQRHQGNIGCRAMSFRRNFPVCASALYTWASGTSNRCLHPWFQIFPGKRGTPTTPTCAFNFSFEFCQLKIIANNSIFANVLPVFADSCSRMVGSTSSFVVVCGPCFGTGQRGEDEPCGVCKSQGRLVLQGNVSEYFDCPSCHGSGYPGVDIHVLCARCKGIGAVRRSN